ncbi:MAG: multidrug effflux MFS transporter [Filimonas sp.]|nr:multidrug effflux MFS transporter [Filimonas sp.]
MSTGRYVTLILVLGSLTALAPFSIDMYLPGFPAIAKHFNTATSTVALTLTGFFVGISAGQLLYGPLLDKYGRKIPLYIGLLVYIITSIGCAFAKDINMLIVMRFVQALGSCAATVAAVAMVRDLFPVKESAKVFALLVLVLGASPMLAPTIGGYITDAFGWQAVFWALAGLGVLILAASAMFLPNAHTPDKTMSLKPGPILQSFKEVLSNPQFYTYSLTGAFAFAGLFAYVSGSPVVFMKVFNVTGKVYGWLFALLSIGFIGASQLNTLMLRKFRGQQIIRFAIRFYCIAASLFFIAAYFNLLTLPLTMIFFFLCLACVGITNPNTASLSLAPFANNAGIASASLGAMQMGLGSLISIFISLFEKPSVMPVVIAMLLSAFSALLILVFGSKRIVGEAVTGDGSGVLAH